MSVTVGEGQKALEALLPQLESDRGFIRKVSPVRSNRASMLGHECLRFLYYMRHDWEKARQKDWKGRGIRGKVVEQWWKNHMSEKGYSLSHDQMPLPEQLFKDFQISGLIDGRISKAGGRSLIYEFKTMDESNYQKINTYDDFLNSKKEYIRRYPAQLQLYLYAFGEEAGLFILCNPDTFEWKPIPVYQDPTFGEYLLERAKLVNAANVTGEAPERISYCSLCRSCDFNDICLPGVQNEGFELLELPQLEGILAERASVENQAHRFKELDEKAKDLAKLYQKDFLLGTSWHVQITRRLEKRIDAKLIPIEERPKYEVEKTKTLIEFVPLSEVKI